MPLLPPLGTEVTVHTRTVRPRTRKLVDVANDDKRNVSALVLEDLDEGPTAVVVIPWHEVTAIHYTPTAGHPAL